MSSETFVFIDLLCTHFVDCIMGQWTVGKCHVALGLDNFGLVSRTAKETQVVSGLVVEMTVTAQYVFIVLLRKWLCWLCTLRLPIAEFVSGFIV